MWVAIFSGGDGNGGDIYGGGRNGGADDGGIVNGDELEGVLPRCVGLQNFQWCLGLYHCRLTAVFGGPWLAPSETQ